MPFCHTCTAHIVDAHQCRRCADNLAQLLHRTADHIPDLDATIARQTRTGTSTGHTGRPTPDSVNQLVVDLTAATARNQLHNATQAWTRRLTDWFPHMPHPKSLRLTDQLRWLANQASTVRHQPIARSYTHNLDGACRNALRTLDRRHSRTHYGPCECGAPLTTPNPPEGDTVTCTRCGNNYDRHKLHTGLLAAARNAYGTPTQIADWLTTVGTPTTAAQVRAHAHRGHIRPDPTGRYCLGDVEAARNRARFDTTAP